MKPHYDDGFGRTWHITPTLRLQGLIRWCSGRTGMKFIAFVFNAIEEKIERTYREQREAGRLNPKDSWVAEEIAKRPSDPCAFQDAKNGGFKMGN